MKLNQSLFFELGGGNLKLPLTDRNLRNNSNN
jgi:hypothetical protein